MPGFRTKVLAPVRPSTAESRAGFSRQLKLAAGVFVILLANSSRECASSTLTVSLEPGAHFSSIQGAIDAAVTGDTILVEEGTYPESIDYQGKGVFLRSVQGPEVTVIDGSGVEGPVVTFENSEPQTAMLVGFTITGGRAENGGGVYCSSGSPLIAGNIIRANHAKYGGGIWLGIGDEGSLPSPHVTTNTIVENTATENGAGIVTYACNATIEGNYLADNRADYDGGGISTFGIRGSLLIRGNTFRSNYAGDHGGGLYLGCHGQSCVRFTVDSNVILGNHSEGRSPSDTDSGGGIYIASGRVTVTRNTIALNTASGQSQCSGGGIAAYSADYTSIIEHNIIAFNGDCGLVCGFLAVPTVGSNLIWSNGHAEVDPGIGFCDEGQVFVDPLFCNLTLDGASVAANSPALTGSIKYGALTDPGCTMAAISPSTWSRIKSLPLGR